MDGGAAFGFVEADRRPRVARITGIIDRARSRTQLQVVLHEGSSRIIEAPDSARTLC